MNQLLAADIFKPFSGITAIAYQGAITPKLLKFEITEAEKTRPLFLASVISREEKIAWQSFQELLSHAVTLAQPGMQGLFGLDVLSVDIQTGVLNFNAPAFATLLTNHSRNFGASHRVLIRYGQLFCMLHKRAPADWGKIEVKTHTEILASGKTTLESHIKKMRRQSGGEPDAIYLIHDLSSTLLWESLSSAPDQKIYYRS